MINEQLLIFTRPNEVPTALCSRCRREVSVKVWPLQSEWLFKVKICLFIYIYYLCICFYYYYFASVRRYVIVCAAGQWQAAWRWMTAGLGSRPRPSWHSLPILSYQFPTHLLSAISVVLCLRATTGASLWTFLWKCFIIIKYITINKPKRVYKL